MKTWLSCSILSLAMVALVSIGAPSHAETPAVKEAPVAKTVVPPAAASAQSSAPANPTAPVAGGQPAAAQHAAVDEDDPLKGIVIHKRPEDFAGAQHLALQNRDERAAMLQKSIACVQQAATMEDLASCQADERKELDKIRLSYCDTMVSFLNGNQNMPKRNKGKGKAGAADTTAGVADTAADAQPERQRGTECDRALATVTGKPVPRRDIEPQPDATTP